MNSVLVNSPPVNFKVLRDAHITLTGHAGETPTPQFYLHFPYDGVEVDFEEVFEHPGGIGDKDNAPVGGVYPSHRDFGGFQVSDHGDREARSQNRTRLGFGGGGEEAILLTPLVTESLFTLG
jgi:hypothetical protein